MTETPESPAATMRRAAQLMLDRADAMDAELRTSRYWGFADAVTTPKAEVYRRGVSGGLGGASGDLAAPWTPEANRALANWLRLEAVSAPEIGEWAFRGGRPVHALAVAAAYLGETSILGEPA
jgi:hypothetical protein